MSSQNFYYWYGEFTDHRAMLKEVDGDLVTHVHFCEGLTHGYIQGYRNDLEAISLDFRPEGRSGDG